MTFDYEPSDATAFALDRRNFDRLPDDLAAGWRREFLKRHSGVAGPQKLIVELLNTCNFDCPMCRVGRHGADLGRRMSMETFERLLDAVPTAKKVRLNGLGETTLLPDLERYLSAITTRGRAPELISNASGPMDSYRAVARAGGHILISWDAATPTMFERLRRPAKWDEYLPRLSEIASLCISEGARCSLLFTLQRDNIDELTGAVELAARLMISAVQVNVVKLSRSDWLVQNASRIEASLTRAGERARSAGLAIFLPDQVAGVPMSVDGACETASRQCDAPWTEMVVRWTGDVQPCNMLNPYVYGNIVLQPTENVWNGGFSGVFRAKINSEDRHPYCRGCAYMPRAYD